MTPRKKAASEESIRRPASPARALFRAFAIRRAYGASAGTSTPSANRYRCLLALALVVPLAFLLTLGSSLAAAAPQFHGFTSSFGSPGSAAGQFDFTSESGIAVDQSTGDLYVADTGNHRVEKFGPSGEFIAAWGWGVATGASEFQVCTAGCRAGLSGHGPGQFEEPTFIAVDNTPGGAGDVYVANEGAVANERQTVTVSATAGTYTLSFTAPVNGTITNGSNLVVAEEGDGAGPYQVGDAISGPGIPAGTTIVKRIENYPVAEWELSADATASGAAVLAVTGITSPIGFDAPANQGQGSGSVQAALEELTSLNERASVSGSAGGPYTVEFIGSLTHTHVSQLTADSAGLSGAAATATVATALDGFDAHGVQKFDASGNLITTWGGTPVGGQLDGTTCSVEGECRANPLGVLYGLVVKPEGTLLVSGGNFTEWMQSSGEFIKTVESNGAPPIGIAVDPAGHVYVGQEVRNGNSPLFTVIQTSYCNKEELSGPCPELNAHEGYEYHKNFVVDSGPDTGVAVDPSDEAVYVARYNPASHHSDVAGYDTEGNVLESSFGGNGEITESAGIAVSGSDSDVYVADEGADRVEIFAPGGSRDALTVTRSGTGLGSVTSEPAGIACPSNCSGHFPEDTEVTLTATPPAHSTFLGFSGAGCSGAAPCHVILTAETAVTATFAYDRPALTAAPASAITRETAILTGTVDPEGDASFCRFEYGPTSAYGSEIPCATQPGSSASPVPVSAQLWDLAASTTYHYRLVALNSGGVSDGPDQSFTTAPEGCAGNAALCPLLSVAPALDIVAIVLPKEPPLTTTKKALTNTQKLAKALTACRKQKKRRARIGCEKQARKRYMPPRHRAGKKIGQKVKRPTSEKGGQA